MKHQRTPLRLRNFDYSDPNHVYFLTICARHLSFPFLNAALADEVISSLHHLRRGKGIPLYCYCLMPDHLHMVVSPSESTGSVSKVVQGFKSFTTRRAWGHGIKGKLWQKSFYDHIVRKEEDLRSICEYILANPVRRGLVGKAEDWPYSGLPDPLPL